jgi:hypothetical protein
MSLIEGVCPLSHTGASLTACPVFGEKANLKEVIHLNRNILENVNLTDRYKQLHESSIDYSDQIHYHHAAEETPSTGNVESTTPRATLSPDSLLTVGPSPGSSSLPSSPVGAISGNSPPIGPVPTPVNLHNGSAIFAGNRSKEFEDLVKEFSSMNNETTDAISCGGGGSNMAAYVLLSLAAAAVLVAAAGLALARWRLRRKGSHRLVQRGHRPARGTESFL